MHITHLSLTNFRNYGRLELTLPLGATLLHGNNAQGKTNLLEALYYLATSRSPQATQDQQLVNWEATQTEEPVVVGRITAQLETKNGKRHIEMRLIQERNQSVGGKKYNFRRQALVDRRPVRLMDLLGNLRVVLFLPQDIQLITGPPSERRRYLDIILCQINPEYCRLLSRYNKALEQRNALLRQLAEGLGSRDTLPIFTDRVVLLGSRLFAQRAIFMRELGREMQRIHYEELTQGSESVRLHYLPRLQEHGLRDGGGDSERVTQLTTLSDWLWDNKNNEDDIAKRFSETLHKAQSNDIARGVTSIGPHRDDWLIEINGRSLRAFGSRGQQRSGVLALKLAEIHWIARQTDDAPILLLDEVAAELDERRRALLLRYVQESTQSLLTATDPGMFPSDFLRNVSVMTVNNGRIQSNNKTTS